MPKTTEGSLEKVCERLDILIRVVAIQVGQDKSLTERARLLKMAGVDNQTIADILNTTPEAVRTYTSNLRAKRRTP